MRASGAGAPGARLFGIDPCDGSYGLAHVPVAYPEAVRVIQAVRLAGGVPVLAHPCGYGNMHSVPDLVGAGLMGLEVYHPSHAPHQEAECLSMARRYGLLVTGGSDFHGPWGQTREFLGDKCPGAQHVAALRQAVASASECAPQHSEACAS